MEEEIKKEKTPTYQGEAKKIYQRGYDLGSKRCKRLIEREAKAKVFVQALWNLFKEAGKKKK